MNLLDELQVKTEDFILESLFAFRRVLRKYP